MNGYYRFPSIHKDSIYFLAEDDIWCVDAEGGIPRRLTAGLGEMGKMAVSADGEWLAVTAREEKHTEVYIAPAAGGPLKRLTYLGADCGVRGFTPEGDALFTSNAAQPFSRMFAMYSVGRRGGLPQKLPVGLAFDMAFGSEGRAVIGRNTFDTARWKRYRGGTAGRLWIDNEGNGQFRPLLDLNGNLASPMWIGGRIYFLSDHEGIANLYSCEAKGGSLRRHTHHGEYYARWAATDGMRVVYQCGADIYLFDPAAGRAGKVDIQWHGPATQTQRRFIRVEQFLDNYSIHPQGHSLAIESRGKPITFGLWEEAVRQYGSPDGVRYRFPEWLSDGKTLVTVSDESGEDRIEIFNEDGTRRRLDDIDLGRVVTMSASPAGNSVALSNHRLELLFIDLDGGGVKVLDRSIYRRIEQLAWSPDGAWLAYDFATSRETSAIKLCEIAGGRSFLATTPEFRDFAPAFDPQGRFLYFLSHRTFDPVYDSFYFDLNFPRSVKPYLVVLSQDDTSPFVAKPRSFEEPESRGVEKEPPPKVRVDVEGIEQRILAFPVPEGIFRQIGGIKNKVFYTSFPITGSLHQDWTSRDIKGGELKTFDFESQKSETVLDDVLSFTISSDLSTLVYRKGNRLRALSTKRIEKPANDKPSRQTGWIDLARVKVSIEPRAEWAQMFRDTWRLQREFFWVEDMSGVDWQRVYNRYFPLLQRVASRAEFSDLIWEMQGELGTSHAYELGGDHRNPPDLPLGRFGADFTYDPDAACYRVSHVVNGDPWDPEQNSAFNAPGLKIREGDRLLAVGARRLNAETLPESQLVNQAGAPVEITIADPDGANVRRVTVTSLRSEASARYREWVETNRKVVHERTKGRVGYVHIPDMGPRGYAEFHRYYSLEAERDALIVDVRYNGGGHVSALILEKLGRRRLGYDFPRWGAPVPYPSESVLGPMVAITNEHAGSDGDMFSHAFKMMKLGPLIGKRTWGGVIGIAPRYRLVDGSVTTQPEFSFWFADVGWGVENYGTAPDIDVEITPQDYAAGRDTQLDKGIELVLRALEENPPALPDTSMRPKLPLPAEIREK